MAKQTLSDLIVSRDESPDRVLSLLRTYGIAAIPNYLCASDLEAVRGECQTLDHEKSEAIIERDYHCGRSLLIDRRLWNPLEHPAIEKLATAKYLQAIAAGFCNKKLAFNYQFLVTRETKSGVPITGLHYDRLLTLKFFIYLLDTSKENGAFECVPGTHKSVEATRAYYVKRGVRLFDLPNFQLPAEIGDPIAMEGAAGTMLVFTTDIVHQGGVVSEGHERWVLRLHTRAKPLPVYSPPPWISRQWWRESAVNPARYYYRFRDKLTRESPPTIEAQ
ncbi:MAG: phytanoyl-CoA dioxygenase family protein [Betaproteobacteria bacterium]|nr:MAG: phytanoyl-CoA dioxygenase family protein [Betaproteobacteria bacterium]